MKNKKYYAYFVPQTQKQGMTDNWEECEKNVKGVPEARFKGFKTKKDAEKWLRAGAGYEFKNIEPGIYFDAGTGRGNGVEVSVTNEKRKSLLSDILPENEINEFGKLSLPKNLTNNYGELLACKYALEIAKKRGVKKIFGDSKIIINYWSKGFVKETEVSEETLNLIDSVKLLRDEFDEAGGAVIYIEGRDNPADLGFHK